MKPKWLITNNCFDDGNPEKIRDAALAAGCEVNWFKYIPFESDKNQNLKFDKGDCVIGYGSIELIKLIQRRTAWIPGAWTDWEALRCANYLSYWGQFSVHFNYAFLPLNEVKRKHVSIFDQYGKDGKVFFRPDSNAKGYAGTGFNAEVVHLNNWDRFIKDGLNYPTECSGNVLTMFSTPSTLLREWRLIVADGKVISGSQYREMIDGSSSVEIKPGYPKDAAEFAEMVVASSVPPAPIFSIDIADVEGKGMRMIEIGSFNCSGLYDCEIPQIVEAANAIAEREIFRLTTE